MILDILKYFIENFVFEELKMVVVPESTSKNWFFVLLLTVLGISKTKHIKAFF